MTFHILKRQEKQEIFKALKEQFGITILSGILLKSGTERIFLFQGSLNEKELTKLEETVPIERAGIYFAKMQGNKIRLSIDGVHLLKDQISKNIFELNTAQMQEWMSGNELNIKTEKHGFLIIKHGSDCLGTGKASEEKITNFIPKSRRLKNKGSF
jgi:NOL1/NOP2/fmu family ribosome biogenesis protein